ncbi:MAG: hypothetical protein AAGF93_20295 [Cyanobacteria bacterium P01_H01_bin.105]
MGFKFDRQGRMGGVTTRSLVVLSVCLLLGSCNRVGERTKDVIDAISIQNLSNGQKLLKNEESDVQLTLPEGWVDVQTLRPDADLYVAREDRTMYVLVLADPKRSEISAFNLADNAVQYLSFLDRGLSQEQPETATNVTSLNGLNAVQYEVQGNVDNLPVVYLHTTVEGENNYYQVVAWTTAQGYPAAKDELLDVIGSFRGT